MSMVFIKRVEWVAAILISLLILFLLVVRAQHAGGLWRDECTSMRLASLSSVADIHERYPYPLLFPALVRIHTSMFGESDASVRAFGVETGIAFIGAAWLEAWLTGTGAPLLLLCLIGLNSLFLTWGTTIRGYGLGTIAIILAIGLAARLLIKPARAMIVMLLLAGLAGPQLLVHDSPLVLGIGAAAVLVCLVRRRLRLALTFIGLAALIGLTCLPYLLGNYQTDRWVVLKFHTTLGWIWMNFAAACGPPASIMPLVWCSLCLVTSAGVVWYLSVSRRTRTTETDLLLFALLICLISIPGYFAFLRILNYWPHPWYYLPLLGALATAIEIMFGGWSPVTWVRYARLGFVVALSSLLTWSAWPKLLERQTNIDLIAHDLEQQVDPADLIVVNPWDHGVTFHRYFHGAAKWVTVPMMNDHSGHRYDLLKAKMSSADPLDDLFETIAQTLQSGARVWLVGGAQFLKPGEIPHWLPPAPNSEFGWSNDAYRNSWSQQLGAFLQQHVPRANLLPAYNLPVNEVENEPVWKMDGWRD